MNSPPPKIDGISITLFLDLLTKWGIKDSIILGYENITELHDDLEYTLEYRTLVDKLLATDPNERYTHIEFIDVKKERESKTLARVWRIADWRVEYRRLVEKRRIQVREGELYHRKMKLIEELTMELTARLGDPYGKEMAEFILGNRDDKLNLQPVIPLAEAYGISGDRFKCLVITEEELDNIIKEQEKK